MGIRLSAFVLASLCLFALVPAFSTAAGASSAPSETEARPLDAYGEVYVLFTPEVGYEESFERIRELAAIVFPDETAEECGRNIRYFAGGAHFLHVDRTTVRERLDEIARKPFVSLADDQAEEWGTRERLSGDLNDSRQLDALDYISAKKMVLGTYQPSVLESYLADINFDRTVDAADYLLMKRAVLSASELGRKLPAWTAPFTYRPFRGGTTEELPAEYRLCVISFSSTIGEAPDAVTVYPGDKILLPAPECESYQFEGWLLDGEAVEDGVLTAESSVELVASWTEAAPAYALNYGCYDGTYYDAVTSEVLQSSETLKSVLHRIVSIGFTKRSYKEVYTDLETTDCFDGTYVECFYTGQKMSPDAHGYWNREHVWAKSHGFENEGSYSYSDLHNLRPTEANINSARGNSYFDELGDECTKDAYGNRWTGDVFEPRDEVKGDVARIMLFMSVRYEGDAKDSYLDLELTDDVELAASAEEYAVSGTVTRAYFGLLSTLIRWSFEDPVDSKEIARNQAIYALQKNRNPFIDYPELVCYLYPEECEALGYTVDRLEDLIVYNRKDDEAIAQTEALIAGIAQAEDKQTAVEAARAAYDALTYESQCFVSNLDVLIAAEKALEKPVSDGRYLFDFTDLGGVKEGDLSVGGVSLHYCSNAANAPNNYGLYCQNDKNVVLTIANLTKATTLTLTMDSNQAAGLSGSVTVSDGSKTVSADYILFRNAPTDCPMDVSGLDASKTWTVTVVSGNSWRIRSVAIEE